ncbi:MAG: hypothetical protein KAR42_14105 [candidate division Zixibacteria bacterium]|nr:hypothetical protein [candidate division Zixibacteria bacterium]
MTFSKMAIVTITLIVLFIGITVIHTINGPKDELRAFYERNKYKDFSVFNDVFVEYWRGYHRIWLWNFSSAKFIIIDYNSTQTPSLQVKYHGRGFEILEDEYGIGHDEAIRLLTNIFKEFKELNALSLSGHTEYYSIKVMSGNRIHYVPDWDALDEKDVECLKCDEGEIRIMYDDHWFACVPE